LPEAAAGWALWFAAPLLAVSLAAAAAAAEGGQASGNLLDEDVAVRNSQAAIGRTVGDYRFTDGRGRKVRLSDYRGKPVIVSLIYTGCSDVCPVVSETLARAVEVARDTLGADSFHVLTIGFDSRHDTPARMGAYARSHGLNLVNWDFLSTDADSADSLAEDLGFVFIPSPRGFDHLSQTTILDAEGHVYGQVYGANFETPLLVGPLRELILGRDRDLATWTGIVNNVRLFCTYYDPASGRYRFDYSIFIIIAMGSLTLGTIAFFLVRAWLRDRHLHAG
jgi:protein SCO1/2